MEHIDKPLISGWLSLTNAYTAVMNRLEGALQEDHDLTLKEFYVLLFLSETSEKKLKLNQLQKMVGLSQSAMSRLVARFEAKGCGALQREICQDDRRNIYTSITTIGEDKLQKAMQTCHSIIKTAITEKDIQEGLRALLLKPIKD
ncbi:DNA-binding MarR family transcriptional regulator [Pullulanibacillus pueri]|uniref:Transcriptional regulator n=1 Tax=Pullulanibacillus pueri TaxID=1437324 RepID=A0A8J2ZY34_9BACL|nr:MarR family winged helix-turn-helix transcriptional regulator [Pullulanibacillus pueri]MBM7680985.1 DNA-binding MarR family transcriptional regulator [Pullulanibacillus pueri]GGH86224.1 transcriptional regulator [Pullulanibacillus pueri]